MVTVERTPRPRKFFFHYNKPAALKASKPKVTVHWNGVCYILDNVVCKVPTKGEIKKRQPHFVMGGYAQCFTIDEGVGYLA